MSCRPFSKPLLCNACKQRLGERQGFSTNGRTERHERTADRELKSRPTARSSAPAPRTIARSPRNCAPTLRKAALGGTEKSRERHVSRGKLLAPRSRRAAARSRLAVPRDRPARRLRHVRGRGAGRGHDRRHRPRVGPAGDDRLQRRDGEGRHLLSADGQEAPSRAGDRRAEPAAVRLSGRQRRREPAAPGRGLSRPRPFRPHLLQPGADELEGHRPDRLRDGQLHRRRRLRPGDERRERHRPQPGHDLPRRPAAGEGGDGRGDQRRGSGRRRPPREEERRRRPSRRE